MLIIGGGKDHLVPVSISKSSFKHEDDNDTEMIELDDHGHAMTIDDNWQEVAETALKFVGRFVSCRRTQKRRPKEGSRRPPSRRASEGPGIRRPPPSLLAGRMSAITSPCARPTVSQSSAGPGTSGCGLRCPWRLPLPRV